MRHALTDRLRDHLAKQRLFRQPGRVVLAVSGGPDSLAMLDMMAALAPELSLELHVAHADHGIHPRSAEVAANVARLAQSVYRLPATNYRLTLKSPTETEARRARYEFLRSVQAEAGARWLATAHHADDQAETVLLRVMKGSAPAGLAGIPVRGPAGLVRPLMEFTREELAAHLRGAGLEPFVDPANFDTRHDRSWLRTAVLPLVVGRRGAAARDALLDVASHARAEVRAWDAALDALPGLEVRLENGAVSVARGALSGYDKVLAGRVLRAAARRAGLNVGPRLAARLVRFAAEAGSGHRMDMSGGRFAEVAFERLVVGAGRSVTPEPRPLTAPSGSAEFGQFALAWRSEVAPASIDRRGWTTWVVPESLGFRPLAPGDRLAPLGGTGHRAVTRLLMEARIARSDRSGWPVLVQGDEPVWIPGVCRGGTLVPAPGAPAMRIDVTAG